MSISLPSHSLLNDWCTRARVSEQTFASSAGQPEKGLGVASAG